MDNITFNELPAAVAEINHKLDLLLKQGRSTPAPEPDHLLTMEELISYLPEIPARQTVYGWVNDRTIPFQKHGKRLYFQKSAIDVWMRNGRRVK